MFKHSDNLLGMARHPNQNFAVCTEANGEHCILGEGPLPDVPYWTSIIAAGIITLFVFPPANLKSFQFLVKLNSVGIICVLYIMGFIIYNACFEEHLKFSTVPLIQPKFYFLGGIMVVRYDFIELLWL
jgi:hypothetical protein